jgi:branched-chain amino acid transport system permease protein
MDLNARWSIWRRQAAARLATATDALADAGAHGRHAARQLSRLVVEQAAGLARAAAARAKRWRGALVPRACRIAARAAAIAVETAAAARARPALWRRGAPAKAHQALAAAHAAARTVVTEIDGWRRRAWAELVELGSAMHRRIAHARAEVARRASDAGHRVAASPAGQGARRQAARASTWMRTGPLAPTARRLDRWLESRRRVPEGRYRIEVATPWSRAFAVAGACMLAALAALPAFGSRNLINELIFVFTMLTLAQYWNLLAGYAGLVSVGQQAFVGLGGYLLFALTIHRGLDPLLAIVLAGAIAAALAVPTALIVFRLRGAYFAIGTWVVAEVYRLVLAQFKSLGGGTGTSLPPSVTNEVAGIGWVKTAFGVSTSAARDIITYWAALTLAAGTILLVYLILRSRYGLALAAIRDSERAAESVGVDNLRTKLKVYIAAAAGTGMVGALIYLQKARISPDAAFSVPDWTANVIFIVVIGGIGTIEGPIVGILVFYALQTNLAHLGTWYLMLLGAFAILVMLFAPRGLWGYLAERHGLALFPVRRRLVANPPAAAPAAGREPSAATAGRTDPA